jgi:hypothetical protein
MYLATFPDWSMLISGGSTNSTGARVFPRGRCGGASGSSTAGSPEPPADPTNTNTPGLLPPPGRAVSLRPARRSASVSARAGCLTAGSAASYEGPAVGWRGMVVAWPAPMITVSIRSFIVRSSVRLAVGARKRPLLALPENEPTPRPRRIWAIS